MSWRQYSCQPQKSQVFNKILRSYRDLVVWERKEGNHWSWHDCFWDISMKKKINNNSWCQILWMGRYYIDVVSDLFQSNDYKNVNGQNWERKKTFHHLRLAKKKSFCDEYSNGYKWGRTNSFLRCKIMVLIF